MTETTTDWTLEKLLERGAYSLSAAEKKAALGQLLGRLDGLHRERCADFGRFAEVAFSTEKGPKTAENLPFLPVSAFKNHELRSIPAEQVYKILTSSGTTGQVPSRIVLDTATAQRQTLALSRIMAEVLGNQRLPMLIVDSKTVLRDRTSFSARGAGILGLSVFGRDHHYLLDENYALDEAVFDRFLEKYDGQPILIFGFTFMVWEFLVEQMAARGRRADLSKAVLIHSGGWKKMIEKAVTNNVFKATLEEKFGLRRVHNFYGMVEQVGSVFLENSLGHLHCPAFSDVIIRDPRDFSVLPDGSEGLVQVVSVLPTSYPGHSILTEDIGCVMGHDDPVLGWRGKYFKIIGRAKKAELRGCSDTFSQKKAPAA